MGSLCAPQLAESGCIPVIRRTVLHMLELRSLCHILHILRPKACTSQYDTQHSRQGMSDAVSWTQRA